MTSTQDDYKVVNGTSYKKETPDRVVRWLETSRERRQRIRIYYGDIGTGRSWMDEYDTMGHVGRSTGDIKIPLLIKNSRSYGGGAILDNCIIRIDVQNSQRKYVTVYKHDKFHLPEITKEQVGESKWAVYVAGKAHATFDTEVAMERWLQFIKGERHSK